MPELAEAPPQTITPEPQVEKQTLKVKAGDIWRQEFAKLEKAEKEGAGEADVPKPVETPKEEPKVEPKPEVKPEVTPEPELKPAAEKPTSPLDVVTAEAKPKEEPDVLAQFDEKTANWKEARRVMKEQSEAKKALEAKIQELSQTPKSQPEEILALAKERDELKAKYEKQEESLKALNYQYSETFQKMVADRDSHVAKIQARVERYGGDSEKVMAALSMPDGRAKNAAIKEALGEIDSEDRLRIHTLIEGLDEKNEKLAEEAKNSSSRWDELQAKRTAELAEEQAKGIQTIEKTFSQIAASLPETVVTMREVPEDVPEASTWNAEIKAARETAMRVLTPGGSDQKESMEIAIKGGRYDSLEKRYLALHKDWVERGKRLQEYDSGGPDFKGGDKPRSEQKLSPSEKFHKAMATLKADPAD